MPAPPSYQKVNPGDSAGHASSSLRSATLPLSTVNEYAESTIAQRISMVSGVAQVQRVRRREVRRARRRRSAQALGARHRHRRGRDRDPERERQPADRHDVRPRPHLHGAGQRPADAGAGVRRRWSSPTATAIRCGSTKWRASTTASRTTRPPSWYRGHAQHQPVDPEAAGHQRRGRSSTRSRQLLPTFREQLPPSVLARRPHRSLGVDPRVGARRQADAAARPSCSSSLVIFLFLRNVSATIIPSLALPVSIVATFAVMYLLELQPRQPVADGADALASASSSTTPS